MQHIIIFISVLSLLFLSSCAENKKSAPGARSAQFTSNTPVNSGDAKSKTDSKKNLSEQKLGEEEEELSDLEEEEQEEVEEDETETEQEELTIEDAAKDLILTKTKDEISSLTDEEKVETFREHVASIDEFKSFETAPEEDILSAISKALNDGVDITQVSCPEGEELTGLEIGENGTTPICKKINNEIVINSNVTNQTSEAVNAPPPPPKQTFENIFTAVSGRDFCRAEGNGGIAADKTFSDGNCQDGLGGSRCRCRGVQTVEPYDSCVKIDEQRNDRVEAGGCGANRLGNGQWFLFSSSHDHSNRQMLLCQFKCTITK